MDLAHPITDVVPSAHGPVLAVLASTSTPLTGRAVAGLTRPRVSQPRVAAILHDLARAGLVIRTPAGSASLFTLNREHLAAGINAKDSICLQLTGRTAASQDHRAAVPELAAAGPAGKALESSFRRLLALEPPPRTKPRRSAAPTPTRPSSGPPAWSTPHATSPAPDHFRGRRRRP